MSTGLCQGIVCCQATWTDGGRHLDRPPPPGQAGTTYSPLAASLNPADLATKLRRLPQLHFVGSEDQIVPPEAAESYLARQGQDNYSRLMIVKGATHGQGWVTRWPALLQTPPPCAKPVGR